MDAMNADVGVPVSLGTHRVCPHDKYSCALCSVSLLCITLPGCMKVPSRARLSTAEFDFSSLLA